MDEHIACSAVGKGVDHVSVDDIGELIVLSREAVHILLDIFVRLLLAAVEVPRG